MTKQENPTGQVVDIHPFGSSIGEQTSTTLIQSDRIKVIRMVLKAGTELSQHKAPGDITVQCIEGQIEFTALGKTEVLQPGQLLYLADREPHSVAANQDSSFLLTIQLDR